MSSPNFPGNYPNNVEKQDTIKVEQEMLILIDFTAFNIESHLTCAFDHLTITDEDGTTLMEKSCGFNRKGTVIVGGQNLGSSMPANITSRTNIVHIFFRSDELQSSPGWSLSWKAVGRGEH